MITDHSGFLYHAWLASAALPAETVAALLNRYETPQNVFLALKSVQDKPEGIPPAGLMALRQNATKAQLDLFSRLLLSHRIRAFTIMDPEYPASLVHLPDPPAILFYQGNLQCLDRRILSMVGSRAASYDSLKATRQIAKKLSGRGIGIISGLADGIDSASHEGCLEGGSPTVAVTGCGLDMVYPAGNCALRDKILENGGLLLSEYAPGDRPLGWHFPYRNRIITGISKALIVMEARIRSGTMTSVQHALNQGKDVFVYPGDPASPRYEGNHQLLREGAIFFTTPEDILEDLGWLDNPEIIGQNIVCSNRAATLSPEEETVISVLKPGKLSFEQISEKSLLQPAALLSTLTMLQIKGYIEALPGKVYRLKEL